MEGKTTGAAGTELDWWEDVGRVNALDAGGVGGAGAELAANALDAGGVGRAGAELD